MSKRVYVVTLDGDPIHVYSHKEQVFNRCKTWFETNRDDDEIEEGFSDWIEGDKRYSDTDEGQEKAWKDYIDMEFESGTWGEYAWYEALMD